MLSRLNDVFSTRKTQNDDPSTATGRPVAAEEDCLTCRVTGKKRASLASLPANPAFHSHVSDGLT